MCALVFDAIDKVWFQMLPRLRPVSCLCVEWMEGPRRVSPKRGAGGRPADRGGGGAWRRKFSGLQGSAKGTRWRPRSPHKRAFWGWWRRGVDEGRGVAKPRAQAAAGGKVWHASPPGPSAKTQATSPRRR